MYIAPLTFADIMETDLYYFDESRLEDPAYIELCVRFCKSLGISQLPGLRQNPTYFELADEGFTGPMPLMTDQAIEVSTHIFSPMALNKFKKSPNNVLFVVENGRIIGVTHICDYNKNQVYLYYYAHILDFETRMRELLILNGYTSDDMIRFFEASAKNLQPPQSKVYEQKVSMARSDRQQKLRETIGDFQGYSITDLMWLARYLKIFKQTREEIIELRQLRNYVMHGQDTVETDGLLFNIESLENHFRRLEIFRRKNTELQLALDASTLKDRSAKNHAKWEVLNQFSQHVFQRSRLMWHYLDS